MLPSVWVALALTLTSRASAQELEPRAYAPSPVGVNFVAVTVARSTGGVVVDPSLPVEDVDATVDVGGIGYGRTMNLFGRTALFVAALPYAWADATGSVGDETRHASRSGLADPRIKLSVNLLGGRALPPREFSRGAPRTIVGVSLTVGPPLGQYDPAKLINLGANRWSFKPEVGVSRGVNNWTIEGYGGVWLFTTNEAFYPGASVRSQDPVLALQGHVSYTMKPRMWMAFDATFYSGGTTSIDGVDKADLQRNSRLGATFSIPLPRQQSLKVAYSAGATTRVGADFRTLSFGWQMSWFD